MAPRATIYKAELTIADITGGHDARHALTLARHPSETEQRRMVRRLAFALSADDALTFGRGLSTEDEPELWQRDERGDSVLCVDVGLPDERELRKACDRAREVVVLAYGGRRAQQSWTRTRAAIEPLRDLRVLALAEQVTTDLCAVAARAMSLDCTINDGHILLTDGRQSVDGDVQQWFPAAGR